MGGDKEIAFNYFKMLELYEGKITLDIRELTDNMRVYLVEFKEELNKHIEANLKNKKVDKYKTNAEYHREIMSGGKG